MAEEIVYKIRHLTDTFYRDYPQRNYPEILTKENRCYTCLCLQTNDYIICIPYRTEIRHTNAFKFTSSIRSREHQSGLDYTKIVIVRIYGKDKYICSDDGIVDRDENEETYENIETIANEANMFINTYVNHCLGIRLLHPREFRRSYNYSTLKYFYKELHI